MKHLFIAAISYLLMFSCSSQVKKPIAKTITVENNKTQNENGSQIQTMFKLDEGKTQFFKDQEMNVTFVKIGEDSRCPKDVNCIWAGVALVELNVMGTYTRPSTIKLATIDDAAKGYSRSAIFNGYKISLQELNPYPENSESKKANSGKNNITIQILKIAESELENSNTY